VGSAEEDRYTYSILQAKRIPREPSHDSADYACAVHQATYPGMVQVPSRKRKPHRCLGASEPILESGS
jgi:hypothetical protein